VKLPQEKWELGINPMDIPSHLQALIDIGYDRVASFEYEADANDPLPGLMESVGYVRGVLRMIAGPVQMPQTH